MRRYVAAALHLTMPHTRKQKLHPCYTSTIRKYQQNQATNAEKTTEELNNMTVERDSLQQQLTEMTQSRDSLQQQLTEFYSHIPRRAISVKFFNPYIGDYQTISCYRGDRKVSMLGNWKGFGKLYDAMELSLIEL